MKRLLTRAIEIFLVIIIIGVSMIFIVNWNHEERSMEIKTETPKHKIEENKNEEKVTQSASTEEIASLFGWKKKVPVKKEEEVIEDIPVIEVEEQIEIKSIKTIKHLGHIVTSNGEEFYFFKNIETDELFRLSIDYPGNGWNLVDIVEEGFILGHEDEKYFIEKNE